MSDHQSHICYRRASIRGSRRRVALRLDTLEDRSTPTTISLTAVADNTLYESDTGALSNGAGQHIYVGKTGAIAGNKIRRAVVEFDLSAIPAGSTINTATLTLNVSRSNNGAQSVTLHRLLNSWGEGTSDASPGGEGDGAPATTGDATWIHRFFNTQTWTIPGGDFAAVVSASQTINAVGNYDWTGAGLTADVQQWFADSATNNGWILIGNESTSQTAKELSSRQNATPANRPTLTVDYSPPSLPDLTLDKSHVGDFRQGDASDIYSIVVQNVGPGSTIGTVTITDVLPAGLTPTNDNNGTINGWNVSFAGQTVTATRNGVLASGNSYPTLPILVAVAANAPPSVTNTATVSGGGETNTSNDSDDDPTTIIQVADLTIDKSHVGDFTQGDPDETYSILVQNVGPGPTSGAVTVTDNLPAGLRPTAANNGTVNGWNVSFVGQTITATRSSVLASGASYPALPIIVAVAANAPPSVVNAAAVTGGGELDTGNNSDDDPTTIIQVADLSIDKSHVGDFTQGDTNRSYTLHVQNSGPGPTRGSVTITDIMPAGLTPTAANTGVVNGWNVLFTGQTITATRSDELAAASSYPDLPVIVDVEFDAPASVVNTATVSGGGEINTANNSDDDPTTIHPYTAPNQPPVNTLPTSFSTDEDVSQVLAGLAVADPDAGNSPIQLTLAVNSGTVTASTSVAGGITAEQLTGNSTGSIVITAKQSAINATLADANGLRFTPAQNGSGTVTLTMTTDDLGHNGTGGPLTDTDTSSIVVNAVNDAPVNTLPATGSTPADTPHLLAGISVADVDAGSSAVSVVLSVTEGRLTLNTAVAGGVTTAGITGNDSGLVTVFAPLTAINATLAAADGLVFTPPSAFAGSATLTLVTNDVGNSGSGGARTDSDTQAITVTRMLDHFTIDAPPGASAGVAFNLTVTARNSAGAAITNFGGSVNLSTSDAQGTLPTNATFTNGVATFAVTLRTAGRQTVTATDAVEPSIFAHGTVTVTPAVATRLVFDQQPTGTIVGAPFLPALHIIARDVFDNVVTTNSTDVVRIRLQNNPAGALLSGVASVRLVNGVATFPALGVSKAGNGYTLSASTAVLPATVSDSFNVSAVVRFTVTASQPTSTAGTAITVTVRALDARGQVVTGHAGKVHITSSDPKAVLPADSALTNGEATFPVTLKTAGARTIAAADLGKPTAHGALAKPIAVSPAAVTALRTTGLVDPMMVGRRQMLTVAAVDAFGNINSSYRGTISWTSSDATAILPASYSFTARDAGKHAFPVTLNTPGLQSVTATDGTFTVVRANILVARPTPIVVAQQDPADAAKSAVVVIGTASNDTIEVSPTNAAGTQFDVRINGVSHGSAFAPTGHLLTYGLGGSDTIRMLIGTGPLAGVQLSVPTVIDAGLGNDLVDATGSAGTVIVLGRDGNDKLTGGTGRDLLIGGRGKDLLHGGAGDDIISSGPTKLDTDLSGLLAVMAEWSDAGTDYVTRLQHLSGTPGGANGASFLAAATVKIDTSVEQLFGDAGRDWFLFSDSGLMADHVMDMVDGEVLTGL